MTVKQYARRLAEAVQSRKSGHLEELCFDLEYDQLVKERWPDEVFDFVIEALRDPVVTSLRGSDSFLRTVFNDFDKLGPQHTELLLQVIDAEAENFGDEMLRHTAADLVARQYDPKRALKLFEQWASRGSSPSRLHMAQVGLEVLIMAKRVRDENLESARSLLREVSSR